MKPKQIRYDDNTINELVVDHLEAMHNFFEQMEPESVEAIIKGEVL